MYYGLSILLTFMELKRERERESAERDRQTAYARDSTQAFSPISSMACLTSLAACSLAPRACVPSYVAVLLDRAGYMIPDDSTQPAFYYLETI